MTKLKTFRERGRSFDAIVRFSNSQGTFEPDGTGTARGLAIKLLDVDGARAIPDDGDTTQDFLMVDHPVFPFPDPKSYAPNDQPEKHSACRKSRGPRPPGAPGAKRVADFERHQGKHVASPLRITYWSAPFWLGPASGTGGHAVKYEAVPRENGSAVPAPPEDRPPDYLSQALSRELQEQEAVFDFKVQLQTDAEKMPVEDVSIEWDENVSPPIAVATLHIAQQRVDGSSTLAVDASRARSPLRPSRCPSTRGTRSPNIGRWVE